MELWHPFGELVKHLEQRVSTGGLESLWEAVREENIGRTPQAKKPSCKMAWH